jgi:predicted dehydrogenase
MKFVVIGLGSMGKRRIRCLKKLGEEDIIGFDLRQDRCDEVSEKYGVKTLSNWKETNEIAADAWIISTPPDLHLHYALMAVKRNISFFTEANVYDEQMPELIDKLECNKIVGVPSCTMRYFEGPRRIKEIINAGDIGKPLNFTYHWGQYLPDWHPWESYKDFYVSKRETGACREIVPFVLEWLIDIFGSIEKISCLKDKLSDLDADIDDIYQLMFKFSNGMMGHLLVDVIARPAIHNIRINGTQGTVEWNYHQDELRVFKVSDNDWTNIIMNAGHKEKGYLYPENPYIDEISDFVGEMKGKSSYPFTFKDEAYAIDMLVRAEKSAIDSSKIL